MELANNPACMWALSHQTHLIPLTQKPPIEIEGEREREAEGEREAERESLQRTSFPCTLALQATIPNLHDKS